MIAQRGCGDQAGTEKTHADMDVEERPIRAQGPRVNERPPWDCEKYPAFLFQLILFNYFLGIFLRVACFPACTDDRFDSGIMWDKDTNRARRCFRSLQNADFHRVRARDGRWLCTVAAKAGCGA